MEQPDQLSLNWRHLRAAAAAVQMGGIRRAASVMHLSQPAVSQAIAKVERLLGEKLFVRLRSRAIEPTDVGRALAERIQRAMGYLESAERELRGAESPRRTAQNTLANQVTQTQLRAFLEVIEQRGYSLAARRLGVSQPSVHRSVHELETLCSQKLFNASAHGAEPTREALAFARWVGLAFREIEQGLEEVREWQGKADGRVVVGTLPLARARILPSAITRFLEDHPEARMSVMDGSFTDLFAALRRGQIDVLVGALRVPSPAADVEDDPLFVEPLCAVVRAGHPLLDRAPPSAQQLAKLEWIVPNQGTPARVLFNAFFTARRVKPPSQVIECSSFMAVRGLLLESDRVALSSVSQIYYEVLSGQLVILPVALNGTERPIGISTRRHWFPTRLQKAFVVRLREAAQEQDAANKKLLTYAK